MAVHMKDVVKYDPSEPRHVSPLAFLDDFNLQAHRVNQPISLRANQLLNGTFLTSAFAPVFRNQLDVYLTHLDGGVSQ